MYNGSGMAVPVGGKDAEPWHFTGGISVFFGLMAIAGIATTVPGQTDQKLADSMTPSTVFTKKNLPNDFATITGVSHRAEQRSTNAPYCVDLYTFTYTVGTAADGPGKTIYTSDEETQSRGHNTKCTTSVQGQPSQVVGNKVPYWAATTATSQEVTRLIGLYSCGGPDDQCMKIVDPAIDYEDFVANAKTLWILGAIFMGVGFPGFFGCCSYTLKAKRQANERKAAVPAQSFPSTASAQPVEKVPTVSPV